MDEKVILCYGDSNTWGYCPETARLYPPDVRWTGVLARRLGEGFRVIEEGLGGRTTVFDDPWRTGYRNGWKGLGYALLSGKPLDAVILMLGTNDLKFTDVYGSARGAEQLVKALKNADIVYGGSSPVFRGQPRILLAAPIAVDRCVDDRPVPSSLKGRHETSLLFGREYARVAAALEVDFLDAALYAHASARDGVHMDAASHQRLGEAMAQKIREMLA